MHPATPNSYQTMRVHNAARKIGCSPRSVRRYIKQGYLRAVRIGRRPWGIYISDVEELRKQRGEHA